MDHNVNPLDRANKFQTNSDAEKCEKMQNFPRPPNTEKCGKIRKKIQNRCGKISRCKKMRGFAAHFFAPGCFSAPVSYFFVFFRIFLYLAAAENFAFFRIVLHLNWFEDWWPCQEDFKTLFFLKTLW